MLTTTCDPWAVLQTPAGLPNMDVVESPVKGFPLVCPYLLPCGPPLGAEPSPCCRPLCLSGTSMVVDLSMGRSCNFPMHISKARGCQQLGPSLRPPKLSFWWAAVVLATTMIRSLGSPAKKTRCTTGFWNPCFLMAVISFNVLLTWTLPGFGCTLPWGIPGELTKNMKIVQRPCWWTPVSYILEGRVLASWILIVFTCFYQMHAHVSRTFFGFPRPPRWKGAYILGTWKAIKTKFSVRTGFDFVLSVTFFFLQIRPCPAANPLLTRQ